MSMIVLAMMAATQVMPWLDRASIDRDARIEASKISVERAKAANATKARRLLASDVESITTVCTAAARLPQSAAFLDGVGKAYFMTKAELSQLKRSCAIFTAGVKRIY